jgi:hypothetical protein
MEIEFGLTKGPFNTKYAPLAALGANYETNRTLKTLEKVQLEGQKRGVSASEKLKQVLISLLTGCEYISEVDSRLRSETGLAQAWGLEGYLERSSLALGLNQLTRMNLDQMEQSVGQIWHEHSRALQHDWRGFLLLELDLSGLPSGKGAEGAEKGYFSGKKSHRTPISPGQCHPIR